MPLDFSHEQAHESPIAGVDEVGRGPCAGPVVACAAILPAGFATRPWASAINDSKKLTAKKREELYAVLTEDCIWALGEASVLEIEQINILRASLLAMRRAIEGLATVPQTVLVDGNKTPTVLMKCHAIIGGDAKCLSIAAASIIAKVTRDRMMAKLAEEFPHYGWDKNAGYGTPKHIAAIEAYGLTPHHRQGWAPVIKRMKRAA
jgi:ribonuclease HII